MLRSVDAQLGDLERLQAPWGICVLHLCGVFHQAARAVVDHEARTVRSAHYLRSIVPTFPSNTQRRSVST